jgi:hypothetical protein
MNFNEKTSECSYLYELYKRAGKPLGQNINGIVVNPYMYVDKKCPGYMS